MSISRIFSILYPKISFSNFIAREIKIFTRGDSVSFYSIQCLALKWPTSITHMKFGPHTNTHYTTYMVNDDIWHITSFHVITNVTQRRLRVCVLPTICQILEYWCCCCWLLHCDRIICLLPIIFWCEQPFIEIRQKKIELKSKCQVIFVSVNEYQREQQQQQHIAQCSKYNQIDLSSVQLLQMERKLFYIYFCWIHTSIAIWLPSNYLQTNNNATLVFCSTHSMSLSFPFSFVQWVFCLGVLVNVSNHLQCILIYGNNY